MAFFKALLINDIRFKTYHSSTRNMYIRSRVRVLLRTICSTLVRLYLVIDKRQICTIERGPFSLWYFSKPFLNNSWTAKNLKHNKNICTSERGPKTASSSMALFKALLITFEPYEATLYLKLNIKHKTNQITNSDYKFGYVHFKRECMDCLQFRNTNLL